MTPERWRQVTGIFHDARARLPAARGAFLDDACAGDRRLRNQVDVLLYAHDRAGTFGEPPIVPGGHSGEALPVAALATPHRRHLFNWIARLATLAVAAAFVYAAWLLMLSGGRSAAFGWKEGRRADGWLVTRVDAGGPAAGILESGDRLNTLDGIAVVGRPGSAFHRRALSIGDTYRVAIERQRKRLEQVLRVDAGPRAAPLTYFFVSLTWCAVGLFIALSRPDQAVARPASTAAVMTGVNDLNPVIQSGPMFHPLHIVIGFHFFCRFPSGRRLTGLRRWIVVLMYGVAAVPFALGLWIHAALLTHGVAGVSSTIARHAALFELRGLLPLVLYYTALVGIVTMIVWNYREITHEDQRRRVRWVVFGSIAALTPQLWLSVMEIVRGLEAASRYALVADAFSVGIPLAVAYAIVQHHVFDIREVIRRSVQYLFARSALQVLFGVPLLALIYTVGMNRQRTIAELVTESTAYLYWLTAAGVSLRYRRPIRQWLDRRFFRDAYDRERMLLDLVEDLGKVDSTAHLADLVREKIELALHPSSIYLWYPERGELALISSSSPLLMPADLPVRARWMAWLEQRDAAARLPLPVDAGLSPHESEWLALHGISVVVPLTDSSARLSGVLLLGEKKSGEPYDANDQQLLNAVAKQAAVVRENVQLRAQVSEEQRVRRDVLARLDGNVVALLKECPSCGACFDGSVERCDRDGHPLTLALPISRTIDGKYELTQLIGKGGMGAVYEARDLRLARTVAVKIMLGPVFGCSAALRRFRREAQAAARLNHANIVDVYDYGTINDQGAYIVMERVPGVTLKAELDRATVLRPAEAAEWFGPILQGLAAAHGKGVVHRDLKPENVIGRRDEKTLRLSVKILDFGLAKMIEGDAPATATVTAAGLVMGTPGYMSPEQILGGPVDQRTDIFAVGVMVVEALTGRRPLHGPAGSEAARPLFYDTYHLPGTTAAARALNVVVQRCLARQPTDRYTSASALAEELMPPLLACSPDALVT